MKRTRLIIAWLFLFSGLLVAQELKICHIDVAQGDATLIVSPSGMMTLIDAGNNGKGTNTVLPYLANLGITSLNYVIATHYHADHIGGLDEVITGLGGAHVGVVYDRGTAHAPPSNATYTDYATAAATASGGRQTVSVGQVIDLGGGVTMLCLATDGTVLNYGVVPGSTSSENDLSSAWLISYGDFRYYTGGDVGGESTSYADQETPIVNSSGIGMVDGLKIDHHGSQYSTNQAFVDHLQGSACVIPVGSNSYGHPVQVVLDRLCAANCKIYQTEVGSGGTLGVGCGWVANGAIIFSTTGHTNFTATFGTTTHTYPLHTAPATYSISGNCGAPGATVSAGTAFNVSDSGGVYSITGLSAGTYTVTPALAGYIFNPSSRSVTVGPNATGINFTAGQAPAFSVHPQSQSISYGQTASLSVTATGTPTLHYTWYQGSSGDTGTPAPGGADSSAYTTPALMFTTSYWVRVTNGWGQADSATATVTVNPCEPPDVTSQTPNFAMCAGQTAGLSVTAAGSAPLHYSWYEGATGNTATSAPGSGDQSTYTSPVLLANQNYWVRVTNACGQDDSSTYSITIMQPPAISTHPAGGSVAYGQSRTLTVIATGEAPLHYQWYKGPKGNTSNPVGTDSTSYETGPLTMTAFFWVRVSNSCGTADSNAATINVLASACDLNMDGTVNEVDLQLIAELLAANIQELPCGFSCADVNDDHQVNSLDLHEVLRAIVK